MALLIWLPVATVNAIIFFLIDTPALYAIHRGLLALQGYYLRTRVQAGIKVQLVRSKLPIVGGELLHGTSGLPSIFVLFNLGALICLFFATLGVDADERDRWVSSPFEYTSTLSQQSNNKTLFSFDRSVRRNLTCKTGDGTRAHYWHVAFNESGEVSYNRSLVKNVFCQAKAPHAQPMLGTQCVPSEGETECLLNTFLEGYWFRGIESNSTVHKLSDQIQLEEQFYINYTGVSALQRNSSSKTFSGTAARVYSYRSNESSLRNHFKKPIVFFLYDSITNSWFFSFGYVVGVGKVSSWPIRLSLYGETDINNFLIRMRSPLTAEVIMSTVSASYMSWKMSTVDIFEALLGISIGTRPVTHRTLTFVKTPMEDVTTLTTMSTVLYSVVIGFAILLFPVKELLYITLVRTGKLSQSQLFGHEYDEMSKNYRIAQERFSSAPPSNGYAILDPTDLESKV